MQRILSILLLLGCSICLSAQNPHGEDFKVNCAACHNADGWEIPIEQWKDVELHKPKVSKTTGIPLPIDTTKFHHNKTGFELTGQHEQIDCRACHETLVFSEAQTDCISCHTDIHQMTVGSDCARCHNADNWLVDDVTQLHQDNGFPLLGAHAAVTCFDCHTSETALRFDRIGNDCINCHLDEFNASTNPNHVDAGFSTNCIECHTIDANNWDTEVVDHSFFPLTKGHEVNDCAACHVSGDFASTTTDCFACHQQDFEETESPNHQAANFTTDCASCHTTDVGWMPADYLMHDADHFPIYMGAHVGTWNDCVDCHSNSEDYAVFTCTNCHTNPETDDAHATVSGYAYENTACLACHPNGDVSSSFDHDDTNFPLTGAHITTDCIECHANGYEGTPTDCASCHELDFQGTTNPNHGDLGLSSDCVSCHSTEPGWMPAAFDNHDDYYVLNGAHVNIANDCASCHNGDYNNTPSTCIGCHQANYDNTTDPNHIAAQFSTDCASCHSEDEWTPATFDHDGQYFPIYSGSHEGEWSECIECHTNPSNYAEFTCVTCHQNPETDDSHVSVAGYSYDSPACLACHPTGDADDIFDHDLTTFPLTGAHINTECTQCHIGGIFAGTPTDCAACHQNDFNQSTNPNHLALGLSNDCASCHTTDPGWSPASFDNHDDFYALNGAHTPLLNECAQCHNGDYNNTPNTCAGCHQADFDGTTDPNHQAAQFSTTCIECHTEDTWTPSSFDHNNIYVLNGAHAVIENECAQCHINDNFTNTPTDCIGCHQMDFDETTAPNHVAAQFSTDCASCHSEDEWQPATFDHDAEHFPINSGVHAGEWDDCVDCHTNLSNYAEFTCVTCHSNPETDDAHLTVGGYVYESTACLVCHPTGDATDVFDHNNTNFPLTGAHITTDCIECHANGYAGTPTDCAACHQMDFTETINPNHVVLGISNDCVACHTTDPGWTPASFDNHDDYYVLNGAHASLLNDCAQCHNGDYNNTPNTCAGCHQSDFDGTADPDHQAAQFSTTCTECHSEDTWTPSSFDHDNIYVLNGAHAVIENECAQCHINNNYTNTPTNCIGCHQDDFNETTDPDHEIGQFSTTCTDCHTEDEWVPSTFDHDNVYPLVGAHESIANECAQCHINNNYTTTPTTCVGCHQADYDGTTNPDHAAAQFSTDCISCHDETAWVPANFDHDAQYFPIYSGEHAGEWDDCVECHTNPNNYTEFTCTNCHINPETDDAHVGINGYSYNSPSCFACHPSGSSDDNFDHNNTNFPLTGAHTMTECIDCHTSGYQGTPTDCASCHTTEYNQTTNPDHDALGISTDCNSCHTTDPGWMPANFPDHNNYYVLDGAHLDIANDCAECHNGNYNNTPNTCVGCHQTDYDNSSNPNHQNLGLSTDCATCHTTAPDWMPAEFPDHDDYYALNGAHALIANECVECHNGDYNNTPNTCFGCHADDFNQTTDPDHQAAQFPTDCLQCHTESEWSPSTLDHSSFYPLTGGHQPIENDCALCHTNGNYNNTPNTCIGCHQGEYDGTSNPSHSTLGLSTDCTTCHTTEPDWMPAEFPDHDNYYALNGAHADIANDCAACHNGNYNNTPNTCYGCHQSEYDNTTNPDHQTAQFSTDCITCHNESAWVPANFDHNLIWPLTGAHATIANDCALCHINGNYSNTPNTCVGCHQVDYDNSVNPNHSTLGLSTDCEMCHTTEPDWEPATFPVHDNYWVIDGAHLDIQDDCIECHNGDYNNTPNTCVGCHQADFDNSTNPNHGALGIPTACDDCHTTEPDWEPATFPIHDNYWVIDGAHLPIENDCVVCHNGDYNNTPNTCVGCHQADYDGTTNPNHSAIGIPTACDDCHTTEPDWMPATFPIHDNYWELNGAHALIANDCAECHNGNYNNTPNTCFGCHENDYNNTTNPNHVAAQFPTTCEDCHSEDAWTPSFFDHNTFYPLTGAHQPIENECALCHIGGNYNNTPNTCDGCHQADYDASINPNHPALGIPITCDDCHTTDPDWMPATFPIHDNYWVLNGAHAIIANDCAECHNGNYNNTPNTCFGCHEDDYNGANNPNHAAAQFPTTCDDCHDETAWTPANFDHDGMYFPIYDGKHEGEWTLCTECHIGGNYASFSCIDCHEHNDPTEVADDHQGVPGYQYNSPACYSCHPDGEE